MREQLVRRLFVGVFLMVALSGCEVTRVVTFDHDRTRARLSVVNLSDYQWQVSASSVAPQATGFRCTVAPRATMRIDVDPGTYQITQMVLSESELEQTKRELEATFAVGNEYRWLLTTLLTESQNAGESTDN